MIPQKKNPFPFMLGPVLALSLLLFAGCDNAPKETASKKEDAAPVIGVLLYKADDTYIALVNEALGRKLEGRAHVLVEAAGNNQLTQDEQLRTMLDKKVSALVINLVNTQAAAGVLDTIKKVGTPVVMFNREPDLAVLKSYNNVSFVGTVAIEAGKMQGELIKRLWDAHPEYDRNGDGKVQFVMFQGEPDNPEALARTEYSIRRARELGLDMQQVGETNVCHWDEGLARKSMELALALHGENIEFVVANNDAMALGAITALQAQGYNLEGGDPARFIPVVGVDATPQARDAIRRGVMSATVEQDANSMAEAISSLVMNAVKGRDFLEGTNFTWDESGVAVRIPYLPFTGDK